MRYTSPSGQEFTLLFDALTRTGGKKAPVSEFPGQDQGAVQDLGELTIVFPVTCYISGPEYDLESDRFWNALAESGEATLDHPRWGILTVLPSTRKQTEEFVNGAMRAVFTIDFIRTDQTQFEFPKVTGVADDQIISDTNEAAVAIADTLEGAETENPREKAGIKDRITGALSMVSGAINKVTGLTDTARSQITGAINEVTREIDTLVASPALLLEAMTSLYRLPAREEIDIDAKIRAYREIYTSLVDGIVNTTIQYGEIFGLVTTGQIGAVAIAAAEATTAGDIETREQAGQIIDDLSSLYADITGSIEDVESAGSFSAGYDAQAAVDQAVSRALGNLVDRAFSLPTERILTLDKDVTSIQLAYELYGDLNNIDRLINFNNFQDTYLLLLQRGTEVRWYV